MNTRNGHAGAAALVAAVKANDVAAARAALSSHPDLRGRLDQPLEGLDFGATPLLAAAAAGNLELVDLLIGAGADINARSDWWAGGFGVLDGDPALGPAWIARGARVDAHAAAHLGRLDLLQALVEADPAVVHAPGGDGKTPLHCAASVGIADHLLDHGARIDALDVDHESTPAQYLVRERQDVVRHLIERGARTDLLMTAAVGDLERSRRHLESDPATIRMEVSDAWFPRRNPHCGGSIYQWTLGAGLRAHAIARQFGHEEVLAMLLARTPDDLALSVACELGDDARVRELLATRPELPSSLGAGERRRLAVAARNNDERVLRRMLSAGWPTDARGQHGGTALHWAAWHGNAGMVRELLGRGAPLAARDEDFGGTPLGWAVHGSQQTGHDETGDAVAVVEALLDAGAEPPEPGTAAGGSEAVRAALRRRGAGPAGGR